MECIAVTHTTGINKARNIFRATCLAQTVRSIRLRMMSLPGKIKLTPNTWQKNGYQTRHATRESGHCDKKKIISTKGLPTLQVLRPSGRSEYEKWFGDNRLLKSTDMRFFCAPWFKFEIHAVSYLPCRRERTSNKTEENVTPRENKHKEQFNIKKNLSCVHQQLIRCVTPVKRSKIYGRYKFRFHHNCGVIFDAGAGHADSGYLSNTALHVQSTKTP